MPTEQGGKGLSLVWPHAVERSFHALVAGAREGTHVVQRPERLLTIPDAERTMIRLEPPVRVDEDGHAIATALLLASAFVPASGPGLQPSRGLDGHSPAAAARRGGRHAAHRAAGPGGSFSSSGAGRSRWSTSAPRPGARSSLVASRLARGRPVVVVGRRGHGRCVGARPRSADRPPLPCAADETYSVRVAGRSAVVLTSR
ncbi:hypothetical protein NKG05_27115 [Oerskovia sp. M15]